MKKSVAAFMAWGILVISVLATLSHFVFELSDYSRFVGLFAPVNESVWEHLKMPFIPTLLWYLIAMLATGRKGAFQPMRWLASCATALSVSVLFIVTFFYTYTGAFAFESLILDGFSMIAGIALGQALALHVFRHAKLGIMARTGAVVFPLILFAMFVTFTFVQPHLPLFLDSPTQSYGIVEHDHDHD